MMNIMKMGKMLKSKKIMINFAKSGLKSENYHKFFEFEHLPTFIIFIFKFDATFPSLLPKPGYFFDFIWFLVIFLKKIRQSRS